MAVTPTSVLGKYRIVREIARSNDIVYEGVDPAMGRRVAIKECHLPQHLSGTQRRERIERFYREAKAAGTLSHPNIVTIFDVGEENDRHYIVMEYLEGHSLREIQQMQGALPLKESLEIAMQLCDALAYAHSKGIVHRDVKPDNVHILPGGIIKLTDFGIARISQEPSITAHGQVFGTPSYMSPEQVASHTVDHRTDIFSLGITLYEMLTGRKPFQGDSVITITYNIMNIQPPMPVGVPPSLHIILQKALAKDVNLRYQNLAAMAQDLKTEKYNIESGNRTLQPSSPMPQQHGTLNTGSVPSEVSGIPAFGQGSQYGPAPQHGYPPQQQGYGQQHPSQYPGQQYPQNQQGYPNYANQQGQQGGASKDNARLVGLTLLVVALLALVIWACSLALSKSQAGHAREAAAATLKQGMVAYNNHDYNAATRQYDAARKMLPGSPEADKATEGLSNIQVALAQSADQRGNAPQAEALYAKATQIYPANASAYVGLGNLYSERRNFPSALREWARAINHDPHGPAGASARRYSASVHLQLAQDAMNAGDLPRARNHWQQAALTNPGSPEAQTAINSLNSNLPSGGPGGPPVLASSGPQGSGATPPPPYNGTPPPFQPGQPAPPQ